MIDPFDVTKFNRTNDELEEFLLFCAVVAGKSAVTQARLLDNMLVRIFGTTPFDKIRRLIRNDALLSTLKESRLGQYNRLCKFFTDAVDINPRDCTIADLEMIRGCGPKTARMFIMHSRPKQRVAAIDTHILKHLKSLSIKVPKATPPSGPTYRRLEADFLRLADDAKMEIADYDLMIWKRYAGEHA